MDVGKPFQDAVCDVRATVQWLRYYAGYADKIAGKTPSVDGDYFTYTRLEPVGVCGLIIAVNLNVRLGKNILSIKFYEICSTPFSQKLLQL